ncbi:hypothetical protein AA700_0923 [Acidiphilium acidophilum DSM 700]|nr:hypothetical protein AA700_0923 [Acidiphilium acidophilum DSM 700]
MEPSVRTACDGEAMPIYRDMSSAMMLRISSGSMACIRDCICGSFSVFSGKTSFFAQSKRKFQGIK